MVIHEITLLAISPKVTPSSTKLLVLNHRNQPPDRGCRMAEIAATQALHAHKPKRSNATTPWLLPQFAESLPVVATAK